MALTAGGIALLCGYGRRIRAALWWLALGHGAMIWLWVMVNGRYRLVVSTLGRNEPNNPNHVKILWHEGWLGLVRNHSSTYIEAYWPYHAEILLAALVLGFGWWRRRRNRAIRPESEPEPSGTRQTAEGSPKGEAGQPNQT